MRTKAVVFPFDLFGSGGTGAGAQLLGDLLQEIIDDTEDESRPVRQQAFADDMIIEEVAFDTIEAVAEWRTTGQRAAEDALAADFALWLSGNHLGCLPLLESLPSETLIVQFDAHLDCYDLYDTHETLTNGNFLRHAKLPTVINVGHRDLFQTDDTIREYYLDAVPAGTDATTALKKCTQKKASIWIDLDADVFDPSVCPAVHSPQPCGLTGPQVMNYLSAIGFKRIRGVSVSEFDPGRDVRETSLNLLGWLLEWMLLQKHSS